jgi:hypothetical protein
VLLARAHIEGRPLRGAGARPKDAARDKERLRPEEIDYLLGIVRALRERRRGLEAACCRLILDQDEEMPLIGIGIGELRLVVRLLENRLKRTG